MQVAKATASWLMGVHDPFVDINIVCATAAEHEPFGPSNDSPHVIGGTWGVRPLRVFCCLICAALMTSTQVMSLL